MSISDNKFKQILLSGIIWRGINVVFSFAFNALLVTQLGAGASGQFFYLLNNLFFAVLLLGIGLESGISYYNARMEISASQLFTLSVIWSVLGAGIFSIVLSFLSSLFRLNQPGDFFLVVYVFGSMLTTFLSAIYFTRHDSKTPNIVASILNLLLIILLPKMPWINNKISFSNYINIYLAFPLLSVLLLTPGLLRQKIFISFKNIRGQKIKPLLLFSLHSFIISLLFNLLKRSDYWLVNKWCLPVDAGNYFQASKVIQLLLLLPALASFSLYPLLIQSIKKNEFNHYNIETESKVMKLVGLYFLIALVLSFGILIGGYWIFPILYGATFSNLYSVTIVLIPGLVFFAATYPLTTYFAGKNQNITTIIYLGLSILILFVCNIILTQKYFIYGAAASSSISSIAYFILMFRRFLLQNKLPFIIKKMIHPIEVLGVLKSFIVK